MYLGQTSDTPFTPGTTVNLNFAISGTGQVAISGLTAIAIQSLLASWAPFSSGAFSLQNVSLDNPILPGSLMVTFTVGAAGAQYTYGLLSSSIAAQINSALPVGTVTPVGLGPGLGTTTTYQQFVQQGGVTLSPLASVSPGGPSWLSTLLPSGLFSNLFGSGSGSGAGGGGGGGSFPWIWVAAGVGALGLIYLVME